MWPALEHVCGKQTPSARKLFVRANLPHVPNIMRRLRSKSLHFWSTANPTWGVIFESSKLEGLFCHVSVKRDVRALSFETAFENVTPSGIGFTYKGNCCAMPDYEFSCGRNTFFPGSRHCTAVLCTQVPTKYTDLKLSLLCIFTSRTDRNSLGKIIVYKFAASESFLHYYRQIFSFPQRRIRWNAF